MVHESGSPVAGVDVTFVRTAGVALESDTLHAITNEEGHYKIEELAADEGSVEGYLEVAPPGLTSYRVDGLTFTATSSRGEGDVLDRWVVDPYFPYVGEVYSRRTGQPIVGASIEFRRTGGVQLFGLNWVNDVYRTETTAHGRFSILHFAYPRGAGEVIGNITVRPADGSGPFVIRDVHLASTQVAYQPPTIARWGVGASLEYVGELYNRATGERVAGISVDFRRIGGLPAAPENFHEMTDANGRFPIFLTAESEGEVIGELTVRGPGASRSDTIDVRIPTFEGDEVRLLGVWGYGFAFNYVGELRRQDIHSAAVGVAVEFRRTGGVPVEPDTFTVTTDRNGRFPLMPVPLEEGEVLFDLHVMPSAPADAFVIKDLRMATTYSNQASLLGVWGIPPS